MSSSKRIHVEPAWSFRDEHGNRLDPKLFQLLNAVHQHGKLTEAAQQVGISYRHGWNLLNNWAAFFGSELVALQKGKGARLTPLGEKLRWAEQRVVARLEPQLKSLASELNLEIQRSLAGASPLLKLHASHGYAVELLPEYADSFQLDLQFRSAEEALAALNRGACDLAGFHLPTETLSEALIDSYSRHLKPRVHRVIRFITRCQGLIVKPDNPLQITQLDDLQRDGVRFINRQKNAGTRALLDELLRRAGIASARIDGYDDEEFTHSAVAAYVAAGMADVGFGVEAAARQFNLDFIPITTEHYMLVCHNRTLQQEATRRLLTMLSSEAFQQAIEQLPGYRLDRCGEVVPLSEVFPYAGS
ncbi:substrate-binding domain-containing protein [Marinobacterium arenosum]|uniref:helix-turn-helix transcriptional regulator n=1 Tax=Marinobacterium arenosum TaxID=2862496 RepID=UPI001C9398BB|nr:substrate-binding domain-containing protein [Marinobacterium arenosum]MBY4675429.1 helix-turn-helix transcriptional regulator [Marinobacterium arenosum]